jgi:ornithine cyclodeaminase/alanine dehydrogenase
MDLEGDPLNYIWFQKLASIDFIAVQDIQKALNEADAVITVTPSQKAYISYNWVSPELILAVLEQICQVNRK